MCSSFQNRISRKRLFLVLESENGERGRGGGEKKYEIVFGGRGRTLAPSRNFSTMSNPYWRDRGRTPTAEQTEYLPPTQSQKPKMLSGEIPNPTTASLFVLTATICLPTASVPSASTIHLRIVRAFSIVSAVVKVLLTMTTIVVSGFNPSVARVTSIGSTLARKRKRRPLAAFIASGSVRKASKTNSGPR